MPHGYKREYNDVLYFKKDHFCPDCKTKLEKVIISTRNIDFFKSVEDDVKAVTSAQQIEYVEGELDAKVEGVILEENA